MHIEKTTRIPKGWYLTYSSRMSKGVNAQDSWTAAMKFVAPAGNGVGVVARLPNVEGDEIKIERERGFGRLIILA